uniref:ASKHA domain-containing protein n=1 Tax=Acetatifactor sp. TaxID=1872090 RepID=UPI0040567EDA
MAILKILQGDRLTESYFEEKARLCDVLRDAGYQHAQPCGGRGVCGKCAVELTGEVSEPNLAEKKAGTRLSCQAVLLGDARVVLPTAVAMKQIEMAEDAVLERLIPMEGRYGAAIDIGTTTLVLKLYDLSVGKCVGQSAMGNPQTNISADVMGRIDAAMRGQQIYLKDLITKALKEMLDDACQSAGICYEKVDVLVISGNTTMLYLLTGRDPVSLSCAPFMADCLYDEEVEILGKKAYLPPCMNAFVGADITNAVLASGMCEKKETALLCDIGTNGEIALWKEGTLYVTSTAAGPAFEGAGISCGCGSVSGAIDRVWIEDREIKAHTIDEVTATGICGSGLVDAISAMLALEEVDETGAMEKDSYKLKDGVCIQGADIRAVQLAKAAIAAGIETLLETAGVKTDEIKTLYLAGGFGSHLNVHSAVEIGLIPRELEQKVRVIGNASLAGAVQLLLCKEEVEDVRRIANCSQHINLGGNSIFSEKYINKMFFKRRKQ